jgi:hypothetical protein
MKERIDYHYLQIVNDLEPRELTISFVKVLSFAKPSTPIHVLVQYAPQVLLRQLRPQFIDEKQLCICELNGKSL